MSGASKKYIAVSTRATANAIDSGPLSPLARNNLSPPHIKKGMPAGRYNVTHHGHRIGKGRLLARRRLLQRRRHPRIDDFSLVGHARRPDDIIVEIDV